MIRIRIVRLFKTYVASSPEDAMLALLMVLVLGLSLIGARNCTRDLIDRTYGTHIAGPTETQSGSLP